MSLSTTTSASASGGVTDGFNSITDGYRSREDRHWRQKRWVLEAVVIVLVALLDSCQLAVMVAAAIMLLLECRCHCLYSPCKVFTAIANIKQDLTTVTITVNKPVLPAHQNMLKVDTNHLDLGFYSLTPNTFASVVNPDVNR